MVAGLKETVREAQQERAARRREKQRRWALKLEELKAEIAAPVDKQKVKAEDVKSMKQAYEDSDRDSSDDDDDDDDNTTRDQQGFDDDDDEFDEDAPLGRVVAAKQEKRKAFLERKIAKVQAKIGKSDKRAATEGALVVHQEEVAEEVLKKADIKVRKGKSYASRAGFDSSAYRKGKEDSKMIDLDRRAIDEK